MRDETTCFGLGGPIMPGKRRRIRTEPSRTLPALTVLPPVPAAI